MNATIFARTTLPGLHYWPGAPERRAYLGTLHRHLFGVEVRLPAPVDNDRSIEFHDIIDCVKRVYMPRPADGQIYFGSCSCELIAAGIAAAVLGRFDVEWAQVTVDEDGECGATVTREAEAEPPSAPAARRPAAA